MNLVYITLVIFAVIIFLIIKASEFRREYGIGRIMKKEFKRKIENETNSK